LRGWRAANRPADLILPIELNGFASATTRITNSLLSAVRHFEGFGGNTANFSDGVAFCFVRLDGCFLNFETP
jgi:hypothetical protein